MVVRFPAGISDGITLITLSVGLVKKPIWYKRPTKPNPRPTRPNTKAGFFNGLTSRLTKANAELKVMPNPKCES